MYEPNGLILIDDMNISQLKLTDLRTKLTIIPVFNIPTLCINQKNLVFAFGRIFLILLKSVFNVQLAD